MSDTECEAYRIRNYFMLRPRLELGSRTNLVLAGYKPAALAN